ncbi:MAG: hypothetical protein DI555_06530 [Novosphingobium pentaromativorans]|uniref:Phage gp6-like head-tail connector protein n=1 Tax=Novosphingobium pentaromativorans TaxID=205844 RepID=A0A2W5P0D7_9SPHN|nr:MAG: hypothetical protein DI555_06530 [Novosphingobium pentaromativorans]
MWQSPVIVTPPAVEPVTLDQAKEFLRVDDADDTFDTEIGLQLAGARNHIESVTGTRLISQVVDLRADSFEDLALIKAGPVASIEEISYLDRDGAAQIIAASDYELTGSGLERGIRSAPLSRWPTASAAGGAITVRATLGYGEDGDAIPQAVRLAILLKLRALFEDGSADIDHLLVNDRIWL